MPDEHDTGPPGPLPLADLPRLELDQLLAQLVGRAQEVMAVQERWRGLLHANRLVLSRLALPDVLFGVVDAARQLVGARYAALGVLAPDGGLADFVHVGMTPEVVERIGHLPQGKGLLGALIQDPRPIRLERIAADPRSSGFPDGHPPMDSFLGVPIRVGEEIFGNVYLAESLRGAFTAEDEELIRALAGTAAMAIENSRLYEAARTRGEWMRASVVIMGRLLSVDDSDHNPLSFVAERTREVADADLVTVVRPPTAGGGLHVDVAVGELAGDVQGMDVPIEGSLAGRVFTTGEPLRLAHPDEGSLRAATLGDLEIGPVMMVPLLGSGGIRGVLTVARRLGRPAFVAEDLDMAAGFAHQAAVTVELVEARSDQERAAMLAERERIAADLHDQVIQRLFGAGLTLQGAVTALGPGRTTDRIQATIDVLDTTIRQIRTTIFQLQRSSGARNGLRARLLDIADEASQSLGFDPAVRFSGVLDLLPRDVAENLEAVLREALSNVVRHARATSVVVELTSDGGHLTLVVLDDGEGPRTGTRRSGLANMRRRAEHHGGTCSLEAGMQSGSRFIWSVPVG